MYEVWRPIKNFPNYDVSNLGRIKNKQGIILKQRKTNWGYYKINLSNNNRKYTKYVHRLVAEAFINNINNKPTVDHIDRNGFNNNINNLRWATMREQNLNRGV